MNGATGKINKELRIGEESVRGQVIRNLAKAGFATDQIADMLNIASGAVAQQLLHARR